MSSPDETMWAASAPEPAAPGERVGEFVLERKVGAGAMGEVHLAKHAVSGEQVAVKLITNRHAADEGFIKRFNREIAVLTRLDHPHIGRALAFGIDRGRPYLAMEFIQGPNLGDVLRERGALFERDVLRLVIQVARGLAYAHTEAGLIHRDIKPDNILIAQDAGGDRQGRFFLEGDQAKIIDFGLAKSVDAEDQRLTLTGIVMGTPSYMSPEQIRCDATLDFHTDMYALGATMFHLLTGRPPYQGTAPALVMNGHLTQPVPDPGTLVPSLNPLTRQLVMTAMAKQVKDRFIDYRGLISACEKALKALGEGGGTTMRLLRKPMVRGGTAAPGMPPIGVKPPMIDDDDDFVALPADRETRSVTRGQHTGRTPATAARPAGSGTSQHLKPTPAVIQTGGEPLVARRDTTPKVALPQSPDAGSEALRKVVTDKIEKVRTTSRFRRDQTRMVAVSLNAPAFQPIAISELPLASRLVVFAPWLLLTLAVCALLAVVLFQRS